MKNKKEFEEWAYSQMDKYGVPRPETYTEDELVYLNPAVPASFIKEHVKKRDTN